MVLYIKTGLRHLADDGLQEQLRDVIETAFAARGYNLVPDFFEDLAKKDIAYIVLDIDGNDNVQGTVLATYEKADASMQSYGLENYIFIDKIAVPPDEWENGIMSSMMYWARKMRFGTKQKQLPTLWRTTNPELSKVYQRFSDFGDNPFQGNDHDVHGFGFYSPNDKPNYDQPRSLFEHMAGIVAANPPTLVIANTGIVPAPPSLVDRLSP